MKHAAYVALSFLLVLSACDDEDSGADALVGLGDGPSDAGVMDADGEPDPMPDVPDLEDVAPEDDVPQAECETDQDCNDGLFCNGVERCAAGGCFADPRPPCTDTLDCTIDSCDEDSDRCLFEADETLCAEDELCDPKAGCYTPRECTRDEDCDDDLFCNGVESCMSGECAPGEPVACGDGTSCTDDSCVEELGACQSVPNHTLCLEGELCNVDEGCEAQPPCTRDDECDDASFCNGAETCNLETGQCEAGTPPEIDDGVACTLDVCSDERAEVLHTPSPARCSDGLFCNGAEVCHPTDGCQEGTPPVLSDGVGCTIDTCNEEDDFIEHAPDQTACQDGLFCNGDEVCHPTDDCQPGEPPAVNDGIGCTIDTCDEVADTILHEPSNGACQDGLFCNGAEVCDPQNDCQPGEAPALDDGVACTTDTCDEDNDQIVHTPNNGACQDGLFCNGAEICDPQNDCQPGAPPSLDDGIECTSGQCDEDTDQIVQTPNDGACQDDLFCNGAEVCDVAQGCQPGAPPALDDGIVCTTDTCDEANDQIIHSPNNGACQDGLFCNGAEVCDPQNDCQPGEAPALDDGVACTTDTCNEDTDQIVHAPNNGACQDGLFCNGAEVCHPTDDCQPGAPPVLSDGVGCTIDTCDEDTDQIVHAPDAARCQDGLFCNGAEICDVAQDCQPGAPPSLDDGVSCTIDSCDEINDQIVHTTNNTVCQDGLFCNGAEVCDPQDDCQPGAPPSLDDGVACTTDTCNEDTDQIVHAPNNGACQDGLFCNGAEVCHPTNDCQPGAPPILNDGVGCTTDTCDEVNDRVVHTPNNTVCQDGLFCNGAEFCDVVQDCQTGAPPALSDGVGCTIDTCDEVNDRVVHTPNNTPCEDGLFCNGNEVCDPQNDCQPGTPPSLDDGIECTSGQCDEDTDQIVQTPNDGVCDNGLVCDGSETCQVDVGCISGNAPPEGTLCLDDPRSLCLDDKCELSRCGDGIRDIEAGEACDDGNNDPDDGCDPECQSEGFDLPGLYSVDPELTYLCQQNILDIIIIDLINYSWDRFDFDVVGDTLRVRGLPAGLPDVTMTQTPAPLDGTFDVTFVNPGGCTETYRLVGVFNSDNTWSGAYSLTLSGSCGECTDHLVPVVSGTRQ